MPTDNDIDYRRFTRADLLDAKANIDAQQYPQNYQRLIAEIAFRESGAHLRTVATAVGSPVDRRIYNGPEKEPVP